MNKNSTFKLGRSVAQVIPFHRCPVKKEIAIITTELVITMAVIAIVRLQFYSYGSKTYKLGCESILKIFTSTF